MKQNYYEILEVDRKASKEIIKKAYTTLAKKYHPDVHSDNEKYLYEEKFKLINEAYETLSDTTKRAEYDQTFTDEIQILKNRILELSKENELLKNRYQNIHSSPKNASYTQTNINNSNYTNQKANVNYSNYANQQANVHYSNYANQQSNSSHQYNRSGYYNKNRTNKSRVNNFLTSLIALFFTFLIFALLISKFSFVLHFISDVLFV